MNILLWLIQILLAFWNITGGTYVVFNYEKLATPAALTALPGAAWIAMGVLQAILGAGLVLPGAFKVMPRLTAVSAAALAVLSLLGLVLYSAYAGSGILWALIPALLATLVGYGRFRQVLSADRSDSLKRRVEL